MAKQRRAGSLIGLRGVGVATIIAVALVYVALRPKDDVLPFQTLLDTLRSMSFVPVQPANRLVQPGTLVQVLTTDPLCLSTVCSQQSSLGSGSAPTESPTFNMQSKSKFDGSFLLQGPEVARLAPGLTLKEVLSVELQLSNVKILELTDADVLKCLQARSPDCTAAAQLRKEANHKVTMVKAALVADVAYSVSFSTKADGRVVDEQLGKLALSLGASLSSEGGTLLRGQQLIWGIRDDELLGSLSPGELPPTGSTGDRASLSVDAEAKVVEARNFVSLPLQPLQQDKQMACWAATGALLRSWKLQQPVDVQRFLTAAGPRWRALYESDTGLSVDQQAELAKSLGLVEEPPQNFTTSAYADLLRQHGPLWITTGNLVDSHARVLVGMVQGQTDDETFFEYLDPRDGSRHYERADEFHEDFENEARRILDIGANVDLRRQILHY